MTERERGRNEKANQRGAVNERWIRRQDALCGSLRGKDRNQGTHRGNGPALCRHVRNRCPGALRHDEAGCGSPRTGERSGLRDRTARRHARPGKRAVHRGREITPDRHLGRLQWRRRLRPASQVRRIRRRLLHRHLTEARVPRHRQRQGRAAGRRRPVGKGHTGNR